MEEVRKLTLYKNNSKWKEDKK